MGKFRPFILGVLAAGLTTATDDAIYSVATGFASLISSKVGDIRREDGGALMNG